MLTDQPQTPFESFAIIALIALGVIALVFAVLWWLARRKLNQSEQDVFAKQQTRIGLELAVADQVGRMRLIRELHQIAVLQVNEIVTKAEAAKLTLDDQNEYAARSFGIIAAQSRDTLADMRRILTLVTEGEQLAQPQPRLKSVSELLQAIRDAGLIVSLDESGESYELRPGAELAIYRVLQECLSNSLKHGGVGTEVWITLTWTETSLKLSLDDDGVRNHLRLAEASGVGKEKAVKDAQVDVEKDLSALVQAVSGPGISQMRQRAEMFGGFLEAHEVPGVGFSVNATFTGIRLLGGTHGVRLNAH
ncbi:MAG: ATP-binding protein [Microbacteriaceae bacterium]